MNNIIKLVTKDSVSINNREFTRVMGGFNENSVIITGKQVGELLDYANEDKSVNLMISRNRKSFTHEHLLDLKSEYLNDQDIKTLKAVGYTNMQIAKANNIYILSHLGLLLYLQIADIKKTIQNLYQSTLKLMKNLMLLE